jgi:hypothetical protein
MRALRDLIRPYAEAYTKDVTLGGSGAVKQLAAKLRDLSRKNDRYFWVCVALLIIVLLASLGFVILFRDQPSVIAGVFAVLGASAYGGVWKMVQLWREKVATDVAIEVVEVLTVAEAMELLKKVFLDRLK